MESEEERIRYATERMKVVDFRSQEYFDSMYPSIRKHLHKNFGIFSMARRRDNLLMWAHYAKSHTGFCVGIKKSSLNAIAFVQLFAVDYSNKFPSRPMFLKEKEQTKYLLKIVTTKSKHWKYEREYRLVNMINPNTAFKLPDDFISEITLGLSMTDQAKEEIKTIRNAKFPKAKLYETLIDTRQFVLKFKEIK